MNRRGPVVQWMRDTAAKGLTVWLLASQLVVLLVSACRSHPGSAARRHH